MLDIITNNWGDLPALYPGESLYRLITTNPCDELYVIGPAGSERDPYFRDRVRWALWAKYGLRGYEMLNDLEDASYLYEPDDLSEEF